MSNFRRDGIGWQIGKLRRNFDEWLEVATRSEGTGGEGFSFPEWIVQMLNFLAWLILILFLAWLGLIIYRLSRNYWLERQGLGEKTEQVTYTHKTFLQLVQTAQTYYNQGDYREACRHLYLALLQALHDRGILPQSVSRTDGEYRRSLAEIATSLFQNSRTVINLHENLIFGNLIPSKQDFENCKTALNQIVEQP
jgi:hypothetical protein